MTTSTHFDIAATRQASALNAFFSGSRSADQARASILAKCDDSSAAMGWWDSSRDLQRGLDVVEVVSMDELDDSLKLWLCTVQSTALS